ncbi:hypothetical protein ACFQO1_01600 [Jejudonia soesokkakensis]|uniref:Uncharacterized protein n=1 Tax=Jejudonia soesokkakensis TaxID=1323432 RepID=A0ABW2MQG7_9FLAO
MIYLRVVFLLCSILYSSCNASKSSEIKDQKSENTIEETNKMEEAGYKKGTIVYSGEENDCEYTIKMEGNSTYFLDPIILENTLKKDGQKVWIKFRGLRQMSRCEKANPIELIEILKRAE